LELIEAGEFGDPAIYRPILDALRNGNDYYLLGVDFPSCIQNTKRSTLTNADIDAQARVDKAYSNPPEWMCKSILSTAGSGKFSSDRTIREYAEKIWNIKPVRRPGPVPVSLERLERTLNINTGFSNERESAAPRSPPFVSLERMTPKM
jgi:starch phosphorylase